MNATPLPSYTAAVIRTGLGMAGGWLIGKGYVTADQLPEIGGLALGLLTLVWSLAHKVTTSKALQAAQDAAKGYRA